MTKTRDLADLGGGFIQAGTGAVQRTVESKLQDVVSVKDFGAVGDGVADDTAAIQAALNAGAGKTIYFPKPSTSYKISTTISIPLNTSIESEPGTIIDASAGISGFSSTNNGIFYTTGGGLGSSLGGGVNATINKGDTTITCNSTVTGLAANDLILISNSADYSWSPHRTYYRQGEFAIVRTVSGSTITLTGPALDTYSALATVTVKKVTTTTCSIHGLRIKGQAGGTSNYSAITVNYGRNVVVEGIYIDEPVSNGIQLRNTFNGVVRNSTVIKTVADGATVESNGVQLVSCQSSSIQNCDLSANYHAASITGGLDIVCRYCSISECNLSSNQLWACDFGHDHNEFCTLRNSTVAGGVQLSGRSCLVTNNVFQEKTGVATTGFIAYTETGTLDSVISDNLFYIKLYPALLCGATAYDALEATCLGGTITFSNNIINDSAGGKTYLDFVNQGCTNAINLIIENNRQEVAGAAAIALMRAISSSGAKMANIKVNRNQIINGSLSVVSVGFTNLEVKNNNVSMPSNNFSPMYFGGGENGTAIVTDNMIVGYGASSIIGGTSGARLKAIVLANNTIIDGQSSCIQVTYVNKLRCTGNTFGNPDHSQYPFVATTEVRGINIVGDTYYSLDKMSLFPTNGYGLETAEFTHVLTVSVATPATSFTILTVPAGTKMFIRSANARTNAAITATTGNYFGIGVDAANRRVDYGVSESAATGGSNYPINTGLTYVQSPSAAVDALSGSEILKLMSVTTNTDGAVLGSNMGGAAQSISVSLNCHLVGRMASV